jgi:hypothetical protein
MLKYLLTLPVFFASAAVSADVMENLDVEAKSHHHSSSSHHHHVNRVNAIKTTFTLTPFSNTGFILSVSPVSAQNGTFAIDANGIITLPDDHHYIVDYSLTFSTVPATQAAQFNNLWNGIGAFQLTNASTSGIVGTVLNFDGSTVIQSSPGTVTTQVLYINENLAGLPVLTPMTGLVTIHRLDSARRRH